MQPLRVTLEDFSNVKEKCYNIILDEMCRIKNYVNIILIMEKRVLTLKMR